MPMTPFIGVRISWLMLARNSLLARFAARASLPRLLQVAGALPHLFLQAEAQQVELVVDPAEADGERDAHGDQHRREAEGREGEGERPRQREDLARQLGDLDADQHQAAGGDLPRLRVPPPGLPQR